MADEIYRPTRCAICGIRPVTPGHASCEPCRAFVSNPANPSLVSLAERAQAAIDANAETLELFDVSHGRRKGARYKP